jgi:hypothetical protein
MKRRARLEDFFCAITIMILHDGNTSDEFVTGKNQSFRHGLKFTPLRSFTGLGYRKHQGGSITPDF